MVPWAAFCLFIVLLLFVFTVLCTLVNNQTPFFQNCLIRVSSRLRLLTATVSFKHSPAKLSQEHGMVGHP